jgi:hypothetical protein
MGRLLHPICTNPDTASPVMIADGSRGESVFRSFYLPSFYITQNIIR